MIKVIYAVDSKSSSYSGSAPPVAGCILAETNREAELISMHIQNTISGVRVAIVGEPGLVSTKQKALPHDFTTHEHSWIGALERLVELEPDRDERLYWEHELKAMRNAYAVLHGEKEDD